MSSFRCRGLVVEQVKVGTITYAPLDQKDPDAVVIISGGGHRAQLCLSPPLGWWHTVAVIADRIVCVDCGGWCHRITHWPEDDPPEPGDSVAYRCSDCGDRWDMVLDPEDFDD